MKQTEIFEVLNKIAPIEYSDEDVKIENAFDNSGILVETDEEINSIVFALDFSEFSLNCAIEKGAKLIVTHHPAIYNPLYKIDGLMQKAVKHGIGIISMHLNLDCAPSGIDYCLMKGLGGEKAERITCPVLSGGYGRVYSVKSQTLKEFVESAKKEFNTDKIVYYGNENDKIKKVASFCGSGLTETEIELASDVDLFVSADIKHHVIAEILNRGKSVVEFTHYASEIYGFEKFYEEAKRNIKSEIYFCIDKRFM